MVLHKIAYCRGGSLSNNIAYLYMRKILVSKIKTMLAVLALVVAIHTSLIYCTRGLIALMQQ